MRPFWLVFVFVILGLPAVAASKPHVVNLGRPTSVKLLVGPSEDKTMDITIRSLNVDGKLKEFTTGSTHDVTDLRIRGPARLPYQ